MRPPAPLVLLALPALALAACGGSAVPVDAAPSAADPGCAQVQVLLRSADELAGLDRRTTTGQSTAAWGDPGSPQGPSVVMRCGVAPPGPTTDPCLGVDGVDWVSSDEAGDGPYTTYGRVPAVQVSITGLAPGDVLGSFTGPVSQVQAQRECS